MSVWEKHELQKIGAADELRISPLSNDGKTYRQPATIWAVVVDGELYVRAYNGENSRWYQAALRQNAARINAAGVNTEVRFEKIAGAINDRIDDAYRQKYGGSPYLKPMIERRARAATLRVIPAKGAA
ncbi:MAG TPA: DUF2255 family protein [Candidatus Acidoferrum sp.]|nr:DUF2255 family protein [Candidatus Acidoferrum sp.]